MILIKKRIIKLIKRKSVEPKKCQRMIDDGLYSGNVVRCEKLVTPPNQFLCDDCLSTAESECQALGYEL